MKPLLPIVFIFLASGALLAAICFLWASLRGLLGDAQADVRQSVAMRRRADLLDQKDAVLRSLKDLEFERQVGKISDDDFKRVEAEFRARAKRILKELDSDLKEHRQKAKTLLSKELERAEKSA